MARGIDWATSLGRPGVGTGVNFDVINDLNQLFNLGEIEGPAGAAGGGGAGGGAAGAMMQSAFGPAGLKLGESQIDNGAGLVLSPVEFTSVLRALDDANLATQESNPTLITEDNEEAVLSIIDRVPIITQSIAIGVGAGQQAEEVRYTIDESDPTISTDPTNTREIGVTVSVTPTLLPDNTIRMKLRPRSAQITEQVSGSVPGITFPRVQESTISTISRVPDRHTLLLGGFYNLIETENENRVPLLGSIPVINFLFSSESRSNEQTSLVFCVTPTSYDPSRSASSNQATQAAQNRLELRSNIDYLEENEPEFAKSRRARSASGRTSGGQPMRNNLSRRR